MLKLTEYFFSKIQSCHFQISCSDILFCCNFQDSPCELHSLTLEPIRHTFPVVPGNLVLGMDATSKSGRPHNEAAQCS